MQWTARNSSSPSAITSPVNQLHEHWFFIIFYWFITRYIENWNLTPQVVGWDLEVPFSLSDFAKILKNSFLKNGILEFRSEALIVSILINSSNDY